MLKASKIVLVLLTLSAFLLGKVYRVDRPMNQHIRADQLRWEENEIFDLTPGQFPTPIVRHTSRLDFTSTLVDSSKNGYGLYSNTTNPLAYVKDRGFVLAYRKWQGIDVSAGFLGASESEDGEVWITPATISQGNYYPGGNPPEHPEGPGARYPSAVATYNSLPTPIWNEYTGASGSGGGTNGGRAMFTWDEFGWLGGSFVLPVYDLNNGCLTLPCDPPDLWVSQAMALEGPTGPILLAVFGEGLGPDNYWLLRSDWYLAGYYGMADPVLFMDVLSNFTSGYTAGPEFDVNASGVGYKVTSAYWANYDAGGPVTLHSLFFSKTVDYGATWTTSGGLEGSGWYYLPDTTIERFAADLGYAGDTVIFVGPDTMIVSNLFLGYEHDVKVDADGGLHVNVNCYLAGNLFSDGSLALANVPGAGFYHFYSPTPEDPGSWQVSFIQDMHESYWFDIGPNNGQAGTATWYRFWPDMALSNEPGSQVIWTAYPMITSWDTTGVVDVYNDIDIVLSKSEDNGLTWTTIGNLTNTPGEDAHETCVHTASAATDSNVYFVFQMPDLNTPTVDPPDNYEDFKQRLYVGHYGPTIALGVDDGALQPNRFALQQNYPNPFNPLTRIDYSLEQAGPVSLDLYDLQGRKVKTLFEGKQQAGHYQVTLDASDLTSGVYFYRLRHNGDTKTRKLVLMK